MDIVKIIAIAISGEETEKNFELLEVDDKEMWMNNAKIVIEALANNNLYITNIPKVD